MAGALGPVELRFSRWQGTPTKLTLQATRGHSGIALHGKVTYGGKPIPVVSDTPGGSPRSASTSTSTSGSPGGGRSSAACRSSATATYRHVLNTDEVGNLFRAAVAGPNVGSVYAPDVVVQIPPP